MLVLIPVQLPLQEENEVSKIAISVPKKRLSSAGVGGPYAYHVA